MDKALSLEAIVCRALQLVNEDEGARDLMDHQKLAATGYALKETPGFTDAHIQILRRTIRDTLTTLSGYPPPLKMLYVLMVDESLFDIHGPTNWAEILNNYNQGRAQIEKWSSDPHDQGGAHFSHILQEAGSRARTIFETSDRLRVQLSALNLEAGTIEAANFSRSRRI